jgi:hypothetical protein
MEDATILVENPLSGQVSCAFSRLGVEAVNHPITARSASADGVPAVGPRSRGEAGPAAPHRGLSSVHKCTVIPVRMKAQGRTIQLEFASGRVVPSKVGGRRGVISGYTAASRRRLLSELGRLDLANEVAFFGTGTFCDSFLPGREEVQEILHRFKARFERAFPDGWSFVRVEWKRRKSGAFVGRWVPHVHLLCGGVPEGATIGFYRQATFDFQRSGRIRLEGMDFRAWLKWNWYESVGSDDIDHLQAGTSCERVRSVNAAGSYAAKYAAKDEEDVAPCYGRAWFIWGRDQLPLAAIQSVEIAADAVVRFSRTARKFVERFGRRHYGLLRRQGVVTFFGDASAWVRLAVSYGCG